jgi:hypothetical protein
MGPVSRGSALMLNETVSARTLGCARVLVFGLWLINVHAIHLEDLAALPPELLSQHGVLRLIPRVAFELMVSEPFGVGLRFVLTGLLAWLILGLPGYRPAAISGVVLITLFDGLAKSLGHINHAKFAMLYASWILVAFPAADAFSLRRGPAPSRPAAVYAAPMIAIALVICTAYMFVGAFRIGTGGIELLTSDSLQFWFIRRSIEHNPTGYTLGLWFATHPPVMLLAQLGFAVGTMMELLAPLCLFWRPFRWLWVPSMVIIHQANLVTMNINFWQNSVLILFFVTDIDRIIAPGALRGRFAWLSRRPAGSRPEP